jgi:Cys-tRNA(Pro)/Cys-tRNA(Cys) deacylase
MTPAVVAVRNAGIAHRVMEYASAVERAYGDEAAAALGVDAACVYKTLVAKLDARQLVVALVPVDAELDLKALAAQAGAKRAEMAAPREAERTTGYVVGGISPFGQRRALPTYVDAGMTRHEQVYVSAGRRGLELAVAPADLIELCRATAAHIARR